MSQETIKILINKKDQISNYTQRNDNKENISNNYSIKINENNNNTKSINNIFIEKSNNYLENLELYKSLPDSVIKNIIHSKKLSSLNHNILFHHYTKKDEGNKNIGKIQSIVINTNLKSSKTKSKIKTKSASNLSKLVYYKKSLKRTKSTMNGYTNLNLKQKKNNNTSQSTINAYYDTNYDYDYDINSNNNFINFVDNSDKFNLLEKRNNFTDLSLKEYLHNEIKTLRTALKNYKDKENNNKENVKNNDDEKNKKNPIESKIIKIQSFIKLNPDNITYLYRPKTERSDITKKNEEKNNVKYIYNYKYNYSKNNINKIINEKNQSTSYKGSYANNYKLKKYRSKIDFENKNFKHIINTKPYSHLSNNGNFSERTQKKSLAEEKKNHKFKYNVLINTQNFYNDSKIDYSSFRKKTITNNPKALKQNNRNFLKHKKEKIFPCKLIKKDNNKSISRITSLIKSIRIKNLSTRNFSNDGDFSKNINSYKEKEIKTNFLNINNENINNRKFYNSAKLLIDLKKKNFNKKDIHKSNIDKKNNYIFKKREKKQSDGNKSGPLYSVKIDYKNLLN